MKTHLINFKTHVYPKLIILILSFTCLITSCNKDNEVITSEEVVSNEEYGNLKYDDLSEEEKIEFTKDLMEGNPIKERYKSLLSKDYKSSHDTNFMQKGSTDSNLRDEALKALHKIDVTGANKWVDFDKNLAVSLAEFDPDYGNSVKMRTKFLRQVNKNLNTTGTKLPRGIFVNDYAFGYGFNPNKKLGIKAQYQIQAKTDDLWKMKQNLEISPWKYTGIKTTQVNGTSKTKEYTIDRTYTFKKETKLSSTNGASNKIFAKVTAGAEIGVSFLAAGKMNIGGEIGYEYTWNWSKTTDKLESEEDKITVKSDIEVPSGHSYSVTLWEKDVAVSYTLKLKALFNGDIGGHWNSGYDGRKDWSVKTSVLYDDFHGKENQINVYEQMLKVSAMHIAIKDENGKIYKEWYTDPSLK